MEASAGSADQLALLEARLAAEQVRPRPAVIHVTCNTRVLASANTVPIGIYADRV